jgi:hypothetical protein
MLFTSQVVVPQLPPSSQTLTTTNVSLAKGEVELTVVIVMVMHDGVHL